MRFRKKPVVVDAVQFLDRPENLSAISLLVGKKFKVDYHSEHPKLKIKTLEGVMEASPGDWIIKGIAGEVYPCKPRIFNETYQRVDRVCNHTEKGGFS